MKVHVFDFDGTLVNTPGREQAEKLYLADKGKSWPYEGFYGRPESLIPPVFPEVPDESFAIQEVAEICRKKECDLSILMTGRPYKLRKRVLEICGHLGLTFDQSYFRGQADCNNKGDTFVFKTSVLEKILVLPLKEVVMWEDREDHYTQFSALFDLYRANYPEVIFTLHRVLPVAG
jgi:hypothetical protein